MIPRALIGAALLAAAHTLCNEVRWWHGPPAHAYGLLMVVLLALSGCGLLLRAGWVAREEVAHGGAVTRERWGMVEGEE